jgi:GNAT superfamily N-acetyltransferase
MIDSANLRADIDAIFWETTLNPPTDASARAAFYDLWLGQYLRLDPDHVYLGLEHDGTVVGYLVGCWANPALSPRFASLSYFQTFAEACTQYPAHLHVNLTAAARNRGIGRMLVNAFAEATAATGLPGVHVVTASTARNMPFYLRHGFQSVATTACNGRQIAFLGRDLETTTRGRG